jgi:single-stranded-DNA-specific exonuclease
MPSKNWVLKEQALPHLLPRYRDMSPVLAQVLYARGFTDPHDAAAFLRGDLQDGNPFAMKGMSKAVARVREAIKRRQPIVVYGDFDADGVTSTALLVQVLKSLGADVEPYIPNRVDEGYGLNTPALHDLSRKGKKLIITVDCGIRSIQEVEDGKAFGLDIIVTDHHSIGPDIPQALAVINPKQDDCKYPEDMLAGVGIAYKLADALLRAASQDRQKPTLTVDELVDLVAIGTVADLAPLDRLENRVLVRRGLERLNQAKRPGLRALLHVASLKPGVLNAMNIGFGIGPRINAAGRLESAMSAYHLLCCTDDNEALELAQKLQILNTQRQELTREAQAVIRERLEAQGESDAPLIFAGDSSFRPGIVGLVAGRLTEEFYRPAVVLEMGEHESRASCRSIPQFDITHALDQCADLLVRHGGHAQAAGFTVTNANIPALRERLIALAREQLDGQELQPTIEIDAEVDAEHLSMELVAELARLEPTGHSNNAPVLMTRNLRVMEQRAVGKTEDHLKLRFARHGQLPLDAIGFGLGAYAQRLPDCVDVAYHLEINEYNGNRTVQLNVQDVRPAGGHG